MSSEFKFPVLRSISVTNYPLYPGSGDGTGFSNDILPGVSVLVGINGIGKTTLLNMLLWLLTGPESPKKADLMRPGSGRRHERKPVKNFDYFATRVGQPIRDAEATIEVLFGTDQTLRITRSLANLKLKKLVHNQTTLAHADEARYIEAVKDLSGAQSDWDFDFVVRHLVFFLEEKSPLLWGQEGQFELLRILFLDPQLSRRCAELSDEIYRLDSQVRNANWHLTDLREEIAALDATAEDNPLDEADSLAVIEQRYLSASQGLEELTENVGQLELQVDHLDRERFEGGLRLDEARLDLRQLEQQYFRRSFPSLPETAELTFGRLLADDGCLVCGSEAHQARQRFLALQKSNACPVCETPQIAKPSVADITPARMKKLVRQAESLAEENQQREDLLRATRDSLVAAKESQRDLWREQAMLASRLDDLRAQGVGGDTRTAALRSRLKEAESELDSKRSDLDLVRRQYRASLGKARDRISLVAQGICQEFASFATTFLEEECQLEFQLTKRAIGQSGAQMEFPAFIVKMASATSQTLRIREVATQVSESQKEFLDLAFRMAVLRTATYHGSPTMLVIETPEASLDFHFIGRAAKMLRNFTYEDAKIRHTVLASSNLNRENMIRSLLGLDQARQRTPAPEIPKRVINLLDIAAKPKSMVKDGPAFRERLAEALSAS